MHNIKLYFKIHISLFSYNAMHEAAQLMLNLELLWEYICG